MSFYSQDDYVKAMAVCGDNRALLESNEHAACLACKRFVLATDALEVHNANPADSGTVLCPKCGADALLPDTRDTPVLYGVYRSEMNELFDRAHGIFDANNPQPKPVAAKRDS